MKIHTTEKLISISKSFTFDRIGKSAEKLMVIVDKENLNLLDAIIKFKKPALQIIYILTDSPEVRARYKYSSRIYPIRANIRSLLRHDIVDEILLCLASPTKVVADEIVLICRQFGVSLLVPEKLKIAGLDIKQNRSIGNNTFKVLETTPRKRKSFLLKNGWEIVFATFALFILAPVLVMISLIIKATSKGPVIFKQMRVGLRGRKFYIYKFRTMVVNAEQLKADLEKQNEADGPAFKIKHDPRITAIGKILRKTGFDEVPQLYNVITGQMALIGPRPLLPSEVSAHEEWQLKRMCIKPGITCTWQIQPDRNTIMFDEWMQMDRDYIENWTVMHDMKVFFGTVKSFFAARGV